MRRIAWILARSAPMGEAIALAALLLALWAW